ncbi:aldo/keto reductase (plasmid) [Saccharobesus litoralis]|uniref:Aldo/keto reductase n=1 Tax=Saccharobesus litoralis TaxID=2172099 RepID=A0A2S0VY59_9ALTE|nr:aldo/keto reductase [Saccharobesus litoralis]AWB69133.1 aldo/keto reductase [Saccharobesus litoralis]
METRRLGKSGLSASVIGLGCWQLGGDFGQQGVDNRQNILNAADNAQIQFWDTADVYGNGQSEQSIGDWQQAHQQTRVIATKLGRNASLYPNTYNYDTMRASIEASLTRLRVSSLDLAQLHCIPPAYMAQDEVWQILEDFRTEGLIKHYGASVETIEQAQLCLDKPGLTSLQIIFNLFRQDAKQALLQQAANKDVGIIVRLPLASGLLSGKFSSNSQFSPSDHRNYNKDGALFNVGETFSGLPFDKALKLVNELKQIMPTSAPLAQLALRWILDHPQVTTVIAGASSAQQVIQNAAAADLPPLSNELHQALNDFYMQHVRQFVRGEI